MKVRDLINLLNNYENLDDFELEIEVNCGEYVFGLDSDSIKLDRDQKVVLIEL